MSVNGAPATASTKSASARRGPQRVEGPVVAPPTPGGQRRNSPPSIVSPTIRSEILAVRAHRQLPGDHRHRRGSAPRRRPRRPPHRRSRRRLRTTPSTPGRGSPRDRRPAVHAAPPQRPKQPPHGSTPTSPCSVRPALRVGRKPCASSTEQGRGWKPTARVVGDQAAHRQPGLRPTQLQVQGQSPAGHPVGGPTGPGCRRRSCRCCRSPASRRCTRSAAQLCGPLPTTMS